MTATVIICAATCAAMICGILFFPEIRIKKFGVATYWLITVVGAAILLATGLADPKEVGRALIADNAVNPLKILALFISMTALSIYLDELGFFRLLASFTLKKARSGQKRLFLYLYLTVSVLTVFTSNDVIVLSFTPFICYFSKSAKIDPVPYLAAEFVAANTWSMALIIGNPTNIYLATAYGIDFVSYLKYSILPTVFAGLTAFCILYLMFRKRLSSPVSGEPESVQIENKPLLITGVVHLAACTVLLAVSSYIGVEMWIVSLCAVGSLIICTLIIKAFTKKPTPLVGCAKRTPYQLVPFVLSMFVLIVALTQSGATAKIAQALSGELPIIKYGVASFAASNLINNIPMSVLFASVLSAADGSVAAVFATVIGSNLGAFFTPIGALAGIMWTNILKSHGLKFSYADFLKLGAAVALPALAAALGGLYLSVTFF